MQQRPDAPDIALFQPAETDTVTARILRHPLLHVWVVMVLVFGAWLVADRWDAWTGHDRFQTTRDAYVAGENIPLAAQVSGYVQTVAANDYDTVTAGQTVVQLDPTDYRTQLDIATGQMQVASAELDANTAQREVQRAQIREAEATLASARAQQTLSDAEFGRQKALYDRGIAGTKEALDKATAQDQQARAQVKLSQAQLDERRADLSELEAQRASLAASVTAATASVRLAQSNVDHTRITAPVDGNIGLRRVRAGQYVAAGEPVTSLISGSPLWIIANFKETQARHLQPGLPVEVTVDAFPSLVLHATVERLSPATGAVFALLPPDNATGNFTKVVQRLPVKLALDADEVADLGLAPGMSVTARVDTRPEAEPKTR